MAKNRRRGTSTYLARRQPLDELFSEELLGDKLVLAERRIAASFDHAIEFARGRYRGTDNYIIGLGNRQRELVRYVSDRSNSFVYEEDLPSRLLCLTKHEVRVVIRQAQYDLLSAQLGAMCQAPRCDVYYVETYGIWQITQSAMDNYRDRQAQARRMMKVDRRNEHGMVRSQRINRGRPAGASVSLAKDTQVV